MPAECLAPEYRCLALGEGQLCNLGFEHTDLRGTPCLVQMEKVGTPTQSLKTFGDFNIDPVILPA